MQETNTYIMWPSRLKIGAKTKKGWYQFAQMLLAYTACWHKLSDWRVKGGCMAGAVLMTSEVEAVERRKSELFWLKISTTIKKLGH